MKVIETLLGNAEDSLWKARLESARVDVLNLDQWQAQKNRFRRKTDGGIDLAISLDRNVHLHDGDVLFWDDASRVAIITRIQLKDVMVIRLGGLLSQSPELLGRTCLELGHALGNQHWPAVVKGTNVYVPLTVNQAVMNSVMKTHAFEGVTYEFVKGRNVIAYLSPHESRRLFGGAESVPHSHVHDIEHSHDHDHELAHEHNHSHEHEHEHEHEHKH
jgi:urease accessory protein